MQTTKLSTRVKQKIKSSCTIKSKTLYRRCTIKNIIIIVGFAKQYGRVHRNFEKSKLKN